MRTGMKKALAIVAILVVALSVFFLACGPEADSPKYTGRKIDSSFLKTLAEDLKRTSPTLGGVAGLAYDDNHKRLIISRGWRGDKEIWDVENGSKRPIPQTHKSGHRDVSFSADGSQFFTYDLGSKDLRVWDTETGDLIHTLPGLYGPVTYAGASNFYLVECEPGLCFFDSRTGTSYPGPTAPRFPDQGGWETVMSSSARAPVAVDLETGLAAVLTHPGYAEDDSTLRLFQLIFENNIPEFQEIAAKKMDNSDAYSEVMGLSLSPKADSLYALDDYGRLHVWSVPSLEKIKTISVEMEPFDSVKFLNGRETVAVAGYAGRFGHGWKEGKPMIKLVSTSTEEVMTMPIPGPGIPSLPFEYISDFKALIAVKGDELLVFEVP